MQSCVNPESCVVLNYGCWIKQGNKVGGRYCKKLSGLPICTASCMAAMNLGREQVEESYVIDSCLLAEDYVYGS
jgi:hypothetical protein